jgi:hypothetical protein
MCALAQEFLHEQDFPERNLLQRASRIPEELLSASLFRGVKLHQSSENNFKVKINLIQNNVNLSCIEPNHQ